MQFHGIDLFDFTSFFAWTFLNFLTRCELDRKLGPVRSLEIQPRKRSRAPILAYTENVKLEFCPNLKEEEKMSFSYGNRCKCINSLRAFRVGPGMSRAIYILGLIGVYPIG